MTINVPRDPVLGLDVFGPVERTELPEVTQAGAMLPTTSGRAAIALGIGLLGVGAGDRVLLPTYHCSTMIAPVKRAGAEPVFFPITSEGRPDLAWLREHAPTAKALLAVHYFGVAHDMTALRAFCDDRGIALIEDCSHSFFGMAGARPVGHWGDIAIASLTKFYPVREGGCLVVPARNASRVRLRAPTLSQEARLLMDTLEMGLQFRRLGWLNGPLSLVFGIKNALRGRNSQRRSDPWLDPALIDPEDCLDESQIPLRASAMTHWVMRRASTRRIVNARVRNYTLLADQLRDVRGIRPLFQVLPKQVAPYVFPLWVDAGERVFRSLRTLGVPVYRWDVVWPGTPVIDGDAGLGWSPHVLQLGCHQDLSENDIRRAADEVKRLVAIG